MPVRWTSRSPATTCSSRDDDLIVNVVDAANLERNLYLTVQLLEMGVPLVVALNMMDVARRRGMQIDTATLAAKLGCPVVPVVAVSGEGQAELQARIMAVADGREHGGFSLAHDEIVEQAAQAIGTQLLEVRRTQPPLAGAEAAGGRRGDRPDP